MPVSQDPNDPTIYWARFYGPDDIRHQVPCSSSLEAELTLIERSGPKSLKDLPDLSVEAVVESHLRRQAGRGLIEHSLRKYRSQLGRFVVVPLAGRSIGNIVLEDCIAIRKRIVGSYSPKSAKARLSAVGHFLNDAQFYGFLAVNPMPTALSAFKVDHAVAPRRPSIPTDEEVALLRANSAPHQLAMLDLITQCGAAPFQMSMLKWVDCDFDRMRIFLRDTVLKCDKPSSPSGRFVKMTIEVAASLLRWRVVQARERKHDLVFTGAKGQPVYSSWVEYVMGRLQTRNGLLDKTRQGEFQKKKPPEPFPKYRAGDFRNVAARRWAASGASLKVLSTRMGHASVDTTWRRFHKHLRTKKPHPLLLAVSQLLKGVKK